MPPSSSSKSDVCTKTEIGPYTVQQQLGSGTFGDVKKVTHAATGRVYACKIMSLQKIKLNNLGEQVKREISVLRQIDHVNVVKLIEVLKDKRFMYIVTELVDGGDLFDKLVDCRHFPEPEARKYFRQTVEGVSYCHSLGISHRDIKPENVLLTEEGIVKIADFGFSNAFLAHGVEEERLMKTLCGTPNYISPEILSHEKYSGIKTDVWSLGILLYFIVAGQLPFDQENNEELFEAIVNCQYDILPSFSERLESLLKGMLVASPADRFTMAQVAGHPWMTVDDVELQPKVAPVVPVFDINSMDTFDIHSQRHAREFQRKPQY
jgi:serine/threonine protein kinase